MPSNSSKRNRRTNRTQLDGIQIAGIVIIALVVVGALWLLIGRNKTNTVATGDYGKPFTTTIQGPKLIGPKQYESAPPMIIDPSKQYFATVKMAKGGQFVIQLLPDKAPLTVNSFVFLASQGYFNGVTFHRVLEGFMAQGGDPTGDGTGGPGYEFKNEDSDLTFDKAGVVAMANSGRDTNGSQFFITFAPQTYLNGN
ncbi:MAG TPA: peptidylprolyl isomerase, partial [Anaerolineales bacterium]|nr:peptidylprolyl isomerase [Anaerolineales bacterium]